MSIHWSIHLPIHRISLALFLLVGSLLFIAKPLHAQTPPIQLWHITFANQTDLNQLAGTLDVWEVDHAANSLLAPLTPEEVAALSQTHTLTLAADQSRLSPPTAFIANADSIPGFACYRTVDESFATLDQLETDYPQLVTSVDIGDSWDKANAGGPVGDDMRVVVITNKAIAGPKFRFMLMGAIHAREYTTAELALRFAESIIQGYGVDADATWLLDHGELHLLTYANPDGRRIAETGQLWRKNTHADDACTATPPSSYGIDLNRNSSFKWGECEGFACSSSFSCNQVYRGDAPASEPEVDAIETYIRTLFPDQRGDALTDSAPDATPGLFISLHSYGQLVLFPWGWTTTHAPNGLGLATLARHFGYPLGYRVCQAGGDGCLYQTDGTTDDYSYGDLGVASFTIELGTDFFQSCTYFENNIVPQGLAALRYAFTAAPQPYLLSQGPDVLNVVAAPQEVVTQTLVTISATVDANRMTSLSGNGIDPIFEPTDRIRGAHFTIDKLPWQETIFRYPFTATDGSFNTTQETISTTVEMACLPSGRHTLYVQGEDEAGDEGIVAAAFITVTNSSPFTATAQAAQATSQGGQPVTYTVFLTNTGITTATYVVEPSNDIGGEADVQIAPSQPITLAAGASVQISVVITPQNNTAGTIVPTVFIVRSALDSSSCRQLQLATEVTGWAYQQRLVYLNKP